MKEGRIFTLQAAQGPPLVRRPSVHRRGLPLLLGRRGEQQGAVARRPAARPAGRRRAAEVRGAERHRACATRGRSPIRISCRAWPAPRRSSSTGRRTTSSRFHKKYSAKVREEEAEGTAKRSGRRCTTAWTCPAGAEPSYCSPARRHRLRPGGRRRRRRLRPGRRGQRVPQQGGGGPARGPHGEPARTVGVSPRGARDGGHGGDEWRSHVSPG